MRILSILPGSGGSFYCQNCLRDTALAEALRARPPRDADAALPARHREHARARRGAGFLRGHLALPAPPFRPPAPPAARAWFAPLDAWPVLRLAARFAGATRPADWRT